MNKREAERFVRACVRYVGGGFHPDDDFKQCVTKDGVKLFTDEAAERHNKRMDLAFKVLGDDIYAIGLAEMQAGGLKHRGFNSGLLNIFERFNKLS